jgi:hypothetical protein
MTINDMSDEEKSGLLVVLMGWEFTFVPETAATESYHLVRDRDGKFVDVAGFTDLYSTSNMALAWRVHLWALKSDIYDSYRYWLQQGTGWAGDKLWWEAPDPQRAWLDKILSLAIEAGLLDSQPAQPHHNRD